jgi:hypothetical protein
MPPAKAKKDKNAPCSAYCADALAARLTKTPAMTPGLLAAFDRLLYEAFRRHMDQVVQLLHATGSSTLTDKQLKFLCGFASAVCKCSRPPAAQKLRGGTNLPPEYHSGTLSSSYTAGAVVPASALPLDTSAPALPSTFVGPATCDNAVPSPGAVTAVQDNTVPGQAGGGAASHELGDKAALELLHQYRRSRGHAVRTTEAVRALLGRIVVKSVVDALSCAKSTTAQSLDAAAKSIRVFI